MTIDPTDEMVQAALDVFLATPTGSIAEIDAGMAKALVAVLAIVERDQVAPLRALIGEFIDPDPCSYDHHGYCQAHGLDPAPCPHQRAKELP